MADTPEQTTVRVLLSRDVLRVSDRLTVRVTRGSKSLQNFVDVPIGPVSKDVAHHIFALLSRHVDELEQKLLAPPPAPPADIATPNEPGPEA